MSEKTPAQKGHVKPGTKIAVIKPVPGVVDSLGLPEGVSFVGAAEAELVLLFVETNSELEELMPGAVADLGPQTVLWVFYRKGSKAAGYDMNRDSIWAIAERLDMRPLGLVSIDETWSAFRLRKAA